MYFYVTIYVLFFNKLKKENMNVLINKKKYIIQHIMLPLEMRFGFYTFSEYILSLLLKEKKIAFS